MPIAEISKPVFSISPNPAALYLPTRLSEGLARIRESILQRQGLCMILGGVGLGKTSLLRLLSLDYEVDQDRYSVAYVHDSRTCKTSFSFLKMIRQDFKVPPKRSEREQMDVIEDYLFQNAKAGKNTIIFIDEAQQLSLEILELVRSLLNFETSTAKWIQVVMAGQLELRDRLLQPRYLMFRDRIVAPLLMQPFTLEETRELIRVRLNHWTVEDPFCPESVGEIHRLSQGIPRRTLLLCQQACNLRLHGQRVCLEHVAEAYRKLQITDPDELAPLTV